MDGLLLGYGRVSKSEAQNDALQVEALKRAGCTRLFSETALGGRWERPELHRMLDPLRPDDVVIDWKRDRLSRSLQDLLLIMERIDAAGAGFESSLHHPASWQYLKTLPGASDDFQLPAQIRRDPCHQGSRIAAVSPDVPKQHTARTQFRHHLVRALPILDPSRMYRHAQQQSKHVHRYMTI